MGAEKEQYKQILNEDKRFRDTTTWYNKVTADEEITKNTKTHSRMEQQNKSQPFWFATFGLLGRLLILIGTFEPLSVSRMFYNNNHLFVFYNRNISGEILVFYLHCLT